MNVRECGFFVIVFWLFDFPSEKGINMRNVLLTTGLLILGFSGSAMAHFGMVIPSKVVVEETEDGIVIVEISFSHPMEMVGMDMAKPKVVHVIANGKAEDVTDQLLPTKIIDKDAWRLEFTPKRPGVYALIMEPTPYWEPAEDCFIVHYTKTYIAAFGEGEGWDEPAGLKTEIVPLTRPFGNYAGNVFQGRVLLDGKPVPHAEVEVEYYNREGKYAAPNEQMVTQVIKADENGVFTCGIPFAGWWGFAALNTSDEKMTHDGEEKDVELGAVIWVEFVAPITK